MHDSAMNKITIFIAYILIVLLFALLPKIYSIVMCKRNAPNVSLK